MSAYWALRSSSGTFIAVLTVIAPMGSLLSGCLANSSLGVGPALILEQLLDRHGPPGSGGGTPHDGARRDVAGHHRARGHQAVLADDDPGQDDRAGADAPALPHRDALEMLESLRRAAHVVVVRRHDARRHEHAVLERGVGGDVALALELAVAADGAEVLDRHAAPDDGAPADGDVLTHRAEV